MGRVLFLAALLSEVSEDIWRVFALHCAYLGFTYFLDCLLTISPYNGISFTFICTFLTS